LTCAALQRADGRAVFGVATLARATMPVDPETVPVVVGGGRYTQHKGTPLDEAMSPVEIMAEASSLAEADSGVVGLLGRVQAVATVESATRTRAKLAAPQGLGVDLYRSMPRSLATACGASPPDERCFLTHDGGNSAQWLVNNMADRIAAGEIQSVLLSGCEVHASLMGAMKAGPDAASALGARWQDAATVDTAPAVRIGPMYVETKIEKTHGLHVPIRVYPMIENSLRSHLGRDMATHMAEVGEMFAGFSEVKTFPLLPLCGDCTPCSSREQHIL
jgi:acetyl-CoA C-acetyltransferase